jgi:hypothetical protein
MAGPDAEEWRAAAQKELNSWQQLDVFDLVDSVPQGATVLGSVPVFRTKPPAKIGEPGVKKFRLAARGTQQKPGVDYGETYSSAMTLTSLRTLVLISAARRRRLQHWDVGTAYLHAKLDRPVYMRMPACFVALGLPADKFLLLKKAVYGLHQSGRLWAETLMSILLTMGFIPCANGDPCLLQRKAKSGELIYVGVYVDDILASADDKDQDELADLAAALRKKVELKISEQVSLLLGIRISRDETTGIYELHQREYTEKVLRQYGYHDAKPSVIPAAESKGAPFEADKGERRAQGNSSAALQVNASNYRRLVGELSWLALGTRFDIAYAVNVLARKLSAPDEAALVAARKLLRYLAGTRDFSLRYSPIAPSTGAGSSILLEAWCDSDFAGDEQTSRSVSGVLLKLNGSPVHWLARQQKTVSRSTSEAEYIAAGDAGRLIVWMRVLLAELGCAQESPTTIFIDNALALDMLRDDGRQFPKRKHIRVIYHWIRETVADGFIKPVWCPTAEQQADLFTKPLPRRTFLKLRSMAAASPQQRQH